MEGKDLSAHLNLVNLKISIQATLHLYCRCHILLVPLAECQRYAEEVYTETEHQKKNSTSLI